MENTIIIDSDILIDFFRGKKEAVEWINNNRNKINFATTVINVFELYTSAYKSFDQNKKIKELEDFLNTIKILDLTSDYAKEAARQRTNLEKSGSMIDMGDLLIASIAITNNFQLKTNNKKHFERIEGLRLV